MPSENAERFTYRRSPDQDRQEPAHHPVIIVGGGPVGLVLALDLARRGRSCVMLERRSSLCEGSRAICWSKRTLEIMGRLGVADPLIDRGIIWRKGKVFHRDAAVFDFDLLPESGHRRPAFINLQQFHFEAACLAAVAATGLVDVRFGHELADLEARADGARLRIATPDGGYQLSADWLVAADGARSSIRSGLGLGFVGQTFDDQFLICDIRMQSERPTERWFWFDPPFNRGQSALLHRQADDVWRLDFQIGPDADRDEETKPENVARRIRAMLGDIDFSFEWISCYRFQCRRLDKFRHGRVIFAGDAAHQVSPFGARGGNSGVQDADNLGWKLALVLDGRAPEALLDSYAHEREQAADENILNSTRSTDFISPKGPGATHLRDAVLDLAATEPFARRFLNSGRLSLPTTYDGSPLNSPDGFAPGEAPALRPGAPAVDAPLGDGWLLDRLGGGFRLLALVPPGMPEPALRLRAPSGLGSIRPEPVVAYSKAALERYCGADRSAVYLIRPDHHVAARWRGLEETALVDALRRAVGKS
jgi:3-(3-hydroxy-phenyl)propionate hydroxylase